MYECNATIVSSSKIQMGYTFVSRSTFMYLLSIIFAVISSLFYTYKGNSDMLVLFILMTLATCCLGTIFRQAESLEIERSTSHYTCKVDCSGLTAKCEVYKYGHLIATIHLPRKLKYSFKNGTLKIKGEFVDVVYNGNLVSNLSSVKLQIKDAEAIKSQLSAMGYCV